MQLQFIKLRLIALAMLFPSFKIEGGDYVLLNDILCIFNLREDYALGLIGQSCNVDTKVKIHDDCLLVLKDKFNL